MLNRRIFVLIVLLGFSPIIGAGNVSAQDNPFFEQGFKPFGSFQAGNIDSVNLQNGMLNLHIPLISYPQRGGKLHLGLLLNYTDQVFMTYDDTCQTNCYYYDYTESGIAIGDDFQMFLARNCPGAGPPGLHQVTTPDGSMHFIGYWDTVSSDGTAYRAASNTGQGCTAGSYTDSVTDRSGIKKTFGFNGQCFSWYEDSNGNKMTRNYLSSLSCYDTGWTDTMNRTISYSSYLSGFVSTSTTGCPGTLPTSAAYLWSLPGVSSGTLTYKLCYATVYVNVPNACGNDSRCEWPPSGSASRIQSVILPDGTSWIFQYDSADPNNPNSVGYGDLLKITFPTGGSISYTWQSIGGCGGSRFRNPFFRAVTSRSLDANDGKGLRTWSYTISFSPNRVMTVQDPDGNQTVHTFTSWAVPNCSSFYETTTQQYQGTSTAGALLQTVTTNYVSAVPSENFTYDYPGALTSRITTAFANGQQRKVEMDYEYPIPDYGGQFALSDGNVITQRDYDYGSGAPGALLRTTTKTYLAASNTNYSNNNLWNLVSSVTVKNGAGTQQGYTSYGFDEYGLVSSSVSTQHDSSPPDGVYRGNQTSVHKWESGSTTSTANCPISVNNGYLVSYSVYNDTGMPDHTADSCGTSSSDANHKTSYSYSTTQTCSQSYFGAYPTTITNPLGQATNYCYDFNTGLITSTTDPNNQTTNYGYDNMLRLTSVSHPDGGLETYAYTGAIPNPYFTYTRKITPTVTFSEAGIVDGLGREIQAKTAVPPSTCSGGYVYVNTSYDDEGRKAFVSNPDCSPTTTTGTTTRYDPLNRVCVVISADGSSVPGTACPTTAPTNDVFTTYSGNCATVTDEAGKSRESCTDGLGRMTSVFEDPGSSPHLNYQTSYTYDALDNLLSVTQSGSRQRTFAYDSLSRLTSSINPESNTAPNPLTTVPTTYTYDANGNLSTKTEPAPNQTGTSTLTLSYCYDALNRMLSKAYTSQSCPMSSPIASYSYDGSGCLGQPTCYNVGHRTGMTDAGGSEAWSYEKMGRTAVDQRATNGITKTTTYSTASAPYNYDGSIAQLIYPSGRTVTYAPNINSQPVSVLDAAYSINYAVGPTTCPNGQAASGACYTPQGSLASLKNGSNLTTTSYYNTRLQPCRVAVNATTTAPVSCADGTNKGDVMDFTYDFHLGASDNGNVYKVTNNRTNASDRNINYAYDSLNRIAAAYTDGNLWGETYSIDTWGNLYGIGPYSGKPAGETLSQGVNGSNQLTNVCSANCYDAAGNLLNDGLNTYTYDAEGHTVTGAGVTYYYDGDGKRVRKSSGTLYWYGMTGDALDETDSSGNLTNEYIFFGGKRIARRDSSSNVFYYFTDHLGTSRSIVQAGQTTPCYDQDFYPYGREVPHTTEIPAFVNTCPQNYKFTGKERDSESGLDNFGARYDSSQYGRFMTPDSASYSNRKNPQSWNLYAYSLNNPVTFRDADGHKVDCLDHVAQCQQDAARSTGNNVQVQTVHDKPNWFQRLFHMEGTTHNYLAMSGDTSSFAPGSNAAKLAGLIADPRTVSVSYNVSPSNQPTPSFFGQPTNINGGSTSYTEHQGYAFQAYIDPSNKSWNGSPFDQDAVDQGLPQANTAEEFGHEVLGHIWGEMLGGAPAGTRANMRDSIIGENAVRALDPTRGQKGLESHHGYQDMPPD